MVKCCVVFCKSGYYKNNEENVHQFRCPKEEDLRKKWARAIPHSIQENPIEKRSCSIYLPRTSIPIKLKKVRKAPTPHQHDSVFKTYEDLPTCLDFAQNVAGNNLFKQLNAYKNLNSIIQWPKISQSCNECVIDSSLCFVSFCSGGLYPVVEKFVKVDKLGKISFGIFGQEVDSSILDIVPGENIYEFAKNIKYFENVRVCHGGPKLEEFPNSTMNICTISTTTRLRHNLCRLVLKKILLLVHDV
ncbi:hypothetical protein QTP88_019359 [Uroleucon formosanum]